MQYKKEKDILDAILVNLEMLESYNNLINEKLIDLEEIARTTAKESSKGKLLLYISNINKDIKNYVTLSNSITDKKDMIQEQVNALFNMLTEKEK